MRLSIVAIIKNNIFGRHLKPQVLGLKPVSHEERSGETVMLELGNGPHPAGVSYFQDEDSGLIGQFLDQEAFGQGVGCA